MQLVAGLVLKQRQSFFCGFARFVLRARTRQAPVKVGGDIDSAVLPRVVGGSQPSRIGTEVLSLLRGGNCACAGKCNLPRSLVTSRVIARQCGPPGAATARASRAFERTCAESNSTRQTDGGNKLAPFHLLSL